MSSTSFYDDLIRDYLLFRGFTSTLKAFEAELKVDKDKGFRVDRIVDQLSSFIASYDLTGLRDAWNHLDQRVFARLSAAVFLSTVRRLENGLLKMYVVNAVQTNRHDKLLEFFEKMSADLQNQPEWKEWFVLPFVKSPEDNPSFAVYFTKQWQDTLLVSLHNFIGVVFHMFKDTPTLLNYEVEQIKMTKLVQENESLKQKIADCLGRDKYETSLEAEYTSTSAASSELMDDFYIIAQEAPPTENKTIRSIIRNISSGLPTSPILGRRQSTTISPRRVENTDDTSSSAAAAKFTVIRGKSKTATSLSAASSTTSDKRRGRPSSESESSNKQGNGSSSSSHIDKDQAGQLKQIDAPSKPNHGDNIQTASRRSSVGGYGSAGGGDFNTSRSTNNNRSAPFILLSQEEYREHHSAITHCKFNASGSLIASSDVNGVIKIWSPSPSPQTIATVISKSSVLALEWASKMDKLLLIGNETGTIRLYDTKEKKTLCEVGVESSVGGAGVIREPRITCLACSPMETSFVCCTRSRSKSQAVPGSDVAALNSSSTPIGRLTLWDMKSMKLEKSLSLEPFSSVINCCVFNHNGQLLLVGASDGNISLYDMRGCECIALWQGHQGHSYTVQFSPDETSCYSLGEDCLFTQWSVNKTGQKMSCTPLHENAAGPFAMATSMSTSRFPSHRPIGKLFASDSEGKQFLTCATTGGIIYSMVEGTAHNVMLLGGHKSPVVTVDWSTAGDCGTCITASLDGNIRVSTILAQK